MAQDLVGSRALSGSADETLRLWDTSTGESIRTFKGHTNWVVGVVLSADGRRALIASGSAAHGSQDAPLDVPHGDPQQTEPPGGMRFGLEALRHGEICARREHAT